MWHDECAIAWNVMNKPWNALFSHLRFMQVAPPFFLICTKVLTKVLGYSDYVYRIIPLISGCLALPVFYSLSKKVFKKHSAVVVALLIFSVNQPLINYSFEFKPYSLDVLFTMLSILFFLNLKIEKITFKNSYLYLVSIFPWFSLVSLYSIAAGFICLVWKNFESVKVNYKTFLKKIFPLFLVFSVSFVLYLKFFIFATYGPSGMVRYWADEFIRPDFSNFIQLFSADISYLFYPMNLIIFAIILAGLGILAFCREKSDFACLSGLVVLIFIISSMLKIYPLYGRLSLFLLPLFLIFMVKALDYMYPKAMFSLVVWFMFALTFFSQIPQTIYYLKLKSLVRIENPRGFIEVLTKEIKPHDVVLVSKNSNIEFYYYSSFFDIKNEVFQEPSDNKSVVQFAKKKLEIGDKCWFFIPYNAPLEMDKYLEKQLILKEYSQGNTKGYLIYAKIVR